jgi:hypothetical protein
MRENLKQKEFMDSIHPFVSKAQILLTEVKQIDGHHQMRKLEACFRDYKKLIHDYQSHVPEDALSMILYLEGDINIAQVYNRPSLKAPFYKSIRKRIQSNLEEFSRI